MTQRPFWGVQRPSFLHIKLCKQALGVVAMHAPSGERSQRPSAAHSGSPLQSIRATGFACGACDALAPPALTALTSPPSRGGGALDSSQALKHVRLERRSVNAKVRRDLCRDRRGALIISYLRCGCESASALMGLSAEGLTSREAPHHAVSDHLDGDCVATAAWYNHVGIAARG